MALQASLGNKPIIQVSSPFLRKPRKKLFSLKQKFAVLKLNILYSVPIQCSNDNFFSCRTVTRVGIPKLFRITLLHGRKHPNNRIRAGYVGREGVESLLPPKCSRA